MSSVLLKSAKSRLFWIIARFCFKAYRVFPIFGSLRASIGIIRRGQNFLVIHRNDGRGPSLPGGIASWRESEESTVRREVKEETGLEVSTTSFRMRYESTADVPCTISVFEVEASGEIAGSWEGSPEWMTIAQLESGLLKSQRPVLDLIKRIDFEAQSEIS